MTNMYLNTLDVSSRVNLYTRNKSLALLNYILQVDRKRDKVMFFKYIYITAYYEFFNQIIEIQN